MAKELKPGEPVTVKREVPFPRKSDAYKQGIKSITPGEIGEVVGPAEGRALTVKFHGIETVVAKQSLVRPGEALTQKDKPAAQKPAKGKSTSGAAPQSAVRAAAETPMAPPQVQARPEQDFEKGARELLNAVANKLLLRGGTRVEQDGVVELSLHDLPEEVRERLQALIDAKLAFNPKDLRKQ